MDTSIELRYAGVVIGRATAVGEVEGDRLFLAIPDPLPIGTKVTLTIDERVVEGRVVGVSESTDLAKAGMRVQLVTGPGTTAAAPSSDRGVESPATPPSSSSSPEPAETQAQADDGTADGAGASGDGVPISDEAGGQSGVAAGGRRRRRKR